MSLNKRLLLILMLLLIVAVSSFLFFRSQKTIPTKMVLIPAGPFIMGSNDVGKAELEAELGNKKPFFLDEHPERILSIGDFVMDRFEVSNEEYHRFIQERRRNPPPYWKGDLYKSGQAHLPVVEVTWYEARDYCHWAGKRLPSESEWEKAARGPEGALFAWGNEFDPKKGNVSAGAHGGIMMSGRFSHDKSVYGVFDMTGNVMEWSADWYRAYPGGDYKSDDFGEQFKVAKGDAFGESGHYALSIFSRLPFRQNVAPETRLPFLGFRCAKDF